MEESLFVQYESSPVSWFRCDATGEQGLMSSKQGSQQGDCKVNCQNLPIYASAVYTEVLLEAAILAASLAAMALVEQEAEAVKARRGDLASYLVI